MLTDKALLGGTCLVVSTYVGCNAIASRDLPGLIISVKNAFSMLGQPPVVAPPAPKKPAVPISRSIGNDYIICLDDGARLKMLKRYLRARYNLSPEEYRRKWGLSPDYPMVAPMYSQRRSDFAKQIGLGKGVRGSRS